LQNKSENFAKTDSFLKPQRFFFFQTHCCEKIPKKLPLPLHHQKMLPIYTLES